MTIQVKPIDGSNGIGCEVHGLTFEALDDSRTRSELVRLWVEHGVIVFRGVEGAEFQLQLSRVFGDVQAHPMDDQTSGNKHKEIVRLTYDPNDADACEIDGKALVGWLPWHMDMIYLDKVSRGAVLRPVVLPDEGGRTGFIDKIKLYEKLNADAREKVDGLSVVYHMDIDFDNLKFARPKTLKVTSRSTLFQDLITKRDQGLFPRVEHPLVYRQKETGRPVLNFSPYFAQEIRGLPKPEGDAILGSLGDLCLDPANAYYHEWKFGDMVLWDNWRMLHCATGISADAVRIMERTQILGDYGLGRLESDGEAIRDEMRVTV
ncbi:TauD/TfdA dioxygenase family protein [Yinghuangia sp. YIM S10712]|uniref:TauD/TfdA dioxygenase family protein n=1 Tax=Yinghuangia sp. YIM S10712 TaxID=3436930 RepID=UPI003F5318D1